MALPGRAKRAADGGPIQQQDEQGGRRHDFLGRHAAETGQHGQALPQRGAVGGDRAQETVERDQIEQADQRFGALDDVGDGLGLERVDRPQQGDAEREREGGIGRPEARAQQG